MGVLALIWGSSFILMQLALQPKTWTPLSPWQVATLRLSVAWLVLCPLLIRHSQHLRTHWRPLLVSGVIGNGIPAVLFATAQAHITSSLSGMLNSLSTLWALVIGVLFFGTRMRGVHVVGVLLGLLGAIGLVALRSDDGLPQWSIFAFLPIVATVCYGLSANIVKRFLYDLPAAGIAALALTFVGPVSMVLAWNSGLPELLRAHPDAWKSVAAVVVLATFGSALALVLWNALLKRTSAVWASSVTYLMPVVAIGWGLRAGEGLTVGQGLMIAVVLVGIYLVNIADREA